MKKCSAKAFAICPDKELCETRDEAIFMDGSYCDKFNEALSMDGSYSEKNKIRTNFAKIFITGTEEKPYYNILYFDPDDREYYIGFSSYCLDYVRRWLSEEFEIVPFPEEMSGSFVMID